MQVGLGRTNRLVISHAGLLPAVLGHSLIEEHHRVEVTQLMVNRGCCEDSD